MCQTEMQTRKHHNMGPMKEDNESEYTSNQMEGKSGLGLQVWEPRLANKEKDSPEYYVEFPEE